MMIRSGRIRRRVAHEVGGLDLALAFDIGRAGFQPHDVGLLQLKFGRVFDRDDAVVVRDEARQRVEQRRFTGAGAAGDDDVQVGLHGAFEQHHHFGREALVVQQVFELERVGAEAANGDGRAIQRQRRNDRVHAGAVRQAGVAHRADFVDAPADLRHDAVDDLHQVLVVAELHGGLFQAAAAFDVHVLRAVDHDFADRRLLEQHFERAEAEGFVEHFLDQAIAFVAVEERVLGVAQVFDDEANLAAKHFAFQLADARQVELVDELGVNPPLDVFEFELPYPSATRQPGALASFVMIVFRVREAWGLIRASAKMLARKDRLRGARGDRRSTAGND